MEITILPEPLDADSQVVLCKQRMPLWVVINDRLDAEVQAASLPQGCIAFRDVCRMQKNPGCFQPTMFMQHVEKPGCVVISFRMRPLIDAEHLLVKLRHQCVISHIPPLFCTI